MTDDGEERGEEVPRREQPLQDQEQEREGGPEHGGREEYGQEPTGPTDGQLFEEPASEYNSDKDDRKEEDAMVGIGSDNDSISDNSTSGSDKDDIIDDDDKSPNNKKRGGKKASDTGKKKRISERVLEARRDFDAALDKIKSQGSRRRRKAFDTTDPMDLDELASALRRRMEAAAVRDCDSIEARQPALAKHQMLPEVLEALNRKHLHEVLLDAGILLAIRSWLEPLPNRCLPAVHLRKALLEALRTLPVETDHLRESGIGRIIIFFARRTQETPAIQRLAKDLVSRWSRPILAEATERLAARKTGGTQAGGAEHDEHHGPSEPERRAGEQLQSVAFKEMAGRISDAGLSTHQKKLVMHMQKKGKSKRT